jgi:hypothetical protein
MTTATKPEIIEQVRFEWAAEPDISARQLAMRFQQKYGSSLVRARRITAAVAEAKAQAPSAPFPCTPWKPWADAEKAPEETLFLIQLHHQKRREGSDGLLCHEAAWARRLRQPLEGLEPIYRVLELVQAYTERERIAYFLNAAPYTADLDGFITFQMWRSEECQQQYEKAITAGVVPVPFLNASEDFLRELLAQGPAKIGEEVWDRLSHHPMFFHAFRQLSDPSDPLPEGWSKILLKFLDDPTGFDALLSPTTAATKAAHS